MAGVVLLARETGRAGRAAAALGWAAALLLLVDPALVGDAGFQLSIARDRRDPRLGQRRWTARIGGSAAAGCPAGSPSRLGVSLAAQAATLPVVLADVRPARARLAGREPR